MFVSPLTPLLALVVACDGEVSHPPGDTGSACAADCDSVDTDTHDTGRDTAPGDTGDSGPAPDTADTAPDTGGDTGDTAPDTGGDTADTPAGPGIILFIGDGMGVNHVAGGGMYLTGSAGSLTMETLPYQGRLRTASLSGLTDSAASSTALGTGTKTYNGRLGIDRDGLDVENLVERARAAGMRTGVVTTDSLTGATPSAQVVHVDDRGDGATIAAAYLADMPDLALGGGLQDFEDLLSTASVNLVQSATDLAAATDDGRPLLGLFADDTFPFVVEGYEAEQPTLAELTAAALAWLDGDPEGFFLVVEGARIDHASHGNLEEFVYDEVLSFDDAVAAAMSWAGGRDATIVVTADHECGGLSLGASNGAGAVPETTWRWGKHTNARVPVYATGTLAAALDGLEDDQLWVYEVLAASIDGATSVAAPTVPTLVDGYTADLGAVVTTQVWTTTFGSGYNQLDALYLTADGDGLYVGIDGVFERGANLPLVLVDLDYGDGTGWGADVALADTLGPLDAAITATGLDLAVSGLGFDAVAGSIGAEEVEAGMIVEYAGLRGLTGDVGREYDFGWWEMWSNYDEGNVAEGATAADAGGTGLTENGLEMLLPWDSLYPAGIPAAGASIGVVVLLVNDDGSYASNQALPPLSAATEPGGDPASIESVAVLGVDSAGVVVSAAAVVP